MPQLEGLTGLLVQASAGNREALDELMPVVYKELRRLAGGYLRSEREGHTLQPTALAHEAYLKLIAQQHVQWRDRAHFFAIAGHFMRRILVDHARQRKAAKRGGTAARFVFDEELDSPETSELDIEELDNALKRLEQMDPRQGRIVELRFFAGLTNEDVAAVLGISTGTVKREWRTAKAWLYRELSGGSSHGR